MTESLTESHPIMKALLVHLNPDEVPEIFRLADLGEVEKAEQQLLELGRYREKPEFLVHLKNKDELTEALKKHFPESIERAS